MSNCVSTTKRVPPYKCPGCAKAGVYFKTVYKPCVRCAARGKK